MGTPNFSEFELLLLKSENELGTAVVLILAWMAASDGVIDKPEAAQLIDISNVSKHGQDVAPIVKLAKERDLDALQLASEIIQIHFRGDKANLFIEMAIGMAIADGYLLAAENFLLRFLADLLEITPKNLNNLFIEATGRSLPPISDPSSREYWEEQSQGNKSHSQSKQASQAMHSQFEKAHSTLGLEVGATVEEIKRAYRKLAHIHHPDRFVSLGEEAVAAANITFQRINEAYENLTNNA